ncbi:MAG: helix-turn-helix domain-containing protein [Anaerolineae bacterium]|nr:helix-turn-helix domain-containing protein [Anaerolineae bacterium]
MSDSSDWVSLRQAADILGVHPATVRNWADQGKLASRRTPGKHRRFRKSDLLQYAESESELQSTEVQVIIQSALGQTRMQVGGGNLTDVAWYERMNEETRRNMREQGRRVLESLREYLANGAPDSGLAEAIRIGKDYARILSDDHLTLPQAVRGFFFFSDFVINSVLTWLEINPPRNPTEWSNVLRHVNTYTNTMLLSIIEYYEEE